MTGREAPLWVVIGLTAAAVAGLAGAFAARLRYPATHGLPWLILAVGVTFGMWAAIGWAWWLTGGVVQ